MELNDLLVKREIDPRTVLVFRHRPTEPQLRKVLPWLAAEKPQVYNAYQQTQRPRVEKAMQKARFVASLIGHEPGRASFVGLYKCGKPRPLTRGTCLQIPENVELRSFGVKLWHENQTAILWFDLALTDILAEWKGRLVVAWPPPE